MNNDKSTQASHQPTDRFQFAVPDFKRAMRKGVPEVILADRKTAEQTLAIARAFLARTGRAILSRVPPETEAQLKSKFAGEAEIEWIAPPRAAVLRSPDLTYG